MRDEREDFGAIERLDREVVSRRSAEALERLIRHAVATVPHYRDELGRQGGIAASSLHAEDLRRFPVLSRSEVRDGVRSGRLLSRRVPWWRRVPTSTTGSTGIPLRFFGDTRSRRPRGLGWRLLNAWAGIRDEERLVRMTVPRPRPSWSPHQPFRSFRRMVRFRQPRDLISIYGLVDDDVPGIVRALSDIGEPYSIYGISSHIYLVAREGLARDLRPPAGPRAVVGTSEGFLTRHREAVSAFLRCPAYSRYGAYEVGGGVAQTCPDNPGVHHVVSELVIAEVVDDDLRPVAPGEPGRVLLTDLTNFAMPLIRYDIGDIAVAAAGCPCGRPWPVVGEIIGRFSDRVVTDDGASHPALELEVALFYYHTDLAKDILQYQFVQRGPGDLEILYVPRSEPDPRTAEAIRQALLEPLRGKARITVTPVSRIEGQDSGKRRLVVQGEAAPRSES
jgi:phenylacetate-CoA ligase